MNGLDEGISRDQAVTSWACSSTTPSRRWRGAPLFLRRRDWARQKIRLYIPPGTNPGSPAADLRQRPGVPDDAQAVAAAPPAPLAPGRNLLANPGFEQPFDDWEYSIPPTVGAVITPDSTTAHSGRSSVLLTSTTIPEFSTFMNAGQVFAARNLSGRRVRMSGWAKLENIIDSAYLSISSSGKSGVARTLAGDALTGTLDWTFYSVEYDVPKDTYLVWARAGYLLGLGRVWWDDLKFEVLGATPKPAVAKKRGR
jgi:hypothetical protein